MCGLGVLSVDVPPLFVHQMDHKGRGPGTNTRVTPMRKRKSLSEAATNLVTAHVHADSREHNAAADFADAAACTASGWDEDGELSVGLLLTRFLEFCGREFNPQKLGISVARGTGIPFELSAEQLQALTAMGTLTPLIEDPLDVTKNVARSCFGIAQVQWTFANALSILEMKGTVIAAQDPNAEILQQVMWAGNSTAMRQHQHQQQPQQQSHAHSQSQRNRARHGPGGWPST